MSELKSCPMRAENGNCSPVGGFCTSVPELYCEAANRAYQTGYHDGATEAMRRAQHMPTVDAVEVVRCRDCVHFGECLVTGNDYCSKGERKENEHGPYHNRR